ncbi:DUF6503 family protein [Psychroserpens algicola]|uniref:DUF6503 family protein n=1 Tax=Psychroserpens algicola TaxID=1719034 RepID=UPI0019544E7D|nr:DUF6503 family protein [Psychroserpens algicola]
MKIKMLIPILSCLILSCNNGKSTSPKETIEEKNETVQKFDNKGHELVFGITQKTGNYQTLLDKKDVVYTYTYKTPDGKMDVSTEKYIFNGELSYGAYKQHERTLPNLEGLIEQGYDGKNYWLKHNGTVLNDDTYLKRVKFNRPTNFYWFAMMQKLLDPGLNYEYLGEKTINSKVYDIVKVSFESKDGTPKDIYQLYINKDTHLVDQFLFTVADFGVMETPYLMTLDYETVDGILIPTKRRYKKSNWDAEVTNDPWIQVTWSDINFNNQLSKETFNK